MTLTEKWWRRGLTPQEGKVVYVCGILTGVAPDVDVLFAGLAEHRGSIVHTPFFWMVCAAGVALLGIVFRQRKRLLLGLALAILIGAATHFVLDAIFVGVKILYPLSNEYFRMRPPISTRYENWLINYVLHPIFLTEIYVCVGAGMLWRYRRAEPSAPGVFGLLRVNRGIAGIAVLVTVIYLLNWYAGAT
jgi:inner membrane protein